jgi:carboxylesterase type B
MLYLFGNDPFGTARTAGERALAEEMVARWAALAHGTAPDAAGLEGWPPYDAESEPYLVLDAPSAVRQRFRRATCDLLRQIDGQR